MNESLCKSLLASENILVLRRTSDHQFQVVGEPPSWAGLVAPGLILPNEEIEPASLFLFLEYFLHDAPTAWASEDAPPLTSCIWTERLSNGEEMSFTATARRLGPSPLLLIRLLGVDFDERRQVLQRAREMSLAHERLRTEISKKETLLHCLVHDVAGPITSIMSCLGLVQLEENISTRGQELLKIGLAEAIRQREMLQGVLNLFVIELGAMENFSTDPATAPDLLDSVVSVLKQLSPGMIMKGVSHRLILTPDKPASWLVGGQAEQLGRVLYNLLENALRHTPSYSTITVRLEDEGSFLKASIADQGRGLEPNAEGYLFERFRQGEGSKGKAGLGLYFCRITIKRWGGEIGCHSTEQGGALFWFRLPKPKPLNHAS